jgi:hypothetical protein
MTRSICLGRRRWRWAIEPPLSTHARPRRLAYLVVMWRSFLWFPLVSTCGHSSDPPASVSAPCETLTDRSQLAGCVGKRVTLRGVVSRSKIPSILGVDVDAEYELSDRLGEATGTLATYMIFEQDPNDQIVRASKSPGTYYALHALDGNGLAKAKPAE